MSVLSTKLWLSLAVNKFTYFRRQIFRSGFEKLVQSGLDAFFIAKSVVTTFVWV